MATLGLNRNIDIAMIKQALSSVILPTSEFLDAVENGNQLAENIEYNVEKSPEINTVSQSIIHWMDHFINSIHTKFTLSK